MNNRDMDFEMTDLMEILGGNSIKSQTPEFSSIKQSLNKLQSDDSELSEINKLFGGKTDTAKHEHDKLKQEIINGLSSDEITNLFTILKKFIDFQKTEESKKNETEKKLEQNGGNFQQEYHKQKKKYLNECAKLNKNI